MAPAQGWDAQIENVSLFFFEKNIFFLFFLSKKPKICTSLFIFFIFATSLCAAAGRVLSCPKNAAGTAGQNPYIHEAEERWKKKIFNLNSNNSNFFFFFFFLSSSFVQPLRLQVFPASGWHQANAWLAGLPIRFSFFALTPSASESGSGWPVLLYWSCMDQWLFCNRRFAVTRTR